MDHRTASPLGASPERATMLRSTFLHVGLLEDLGFTATTKVIAKPGAHDVRVMIPEEIRFRIGGEGTGPR